MLSGILIGLAIAAVIVIVVYFVIVLSWGGFN
jgi:hypothetical protein